MVEMDMMKKPTSYSWWFDSHSTTKRSPWLQSSLAELDKRTQAMLKLIEEDADSFAQRAEMYYKKRPELISMVEEFYRTHRSLAERYDQVKPDSGGRLLTTLGSPFSSTKHHHHQEKPINLMDHNYDTYSEITDLDDSAVSEVDDPEVEDHPAPHVDEEVKKHEVVSNGVKNDEVEKLREEMERLKEENIIQKEQLMKKDEEKIEVIRQLSYAVDLLKDENLKLRRKLIAIGKESPPKKWNPFELSHLKKTFLGKMFPVSPKHPQATVVAL